MERLERMIFQAVESSADKKEKDMKNLDYFYDTIKENNYKVTNQRKVILKMFLANKNEHMTVDQVHQSLIIDNPNIGLATVYRNVQLLSELNILNKLKLNDGFTRYELILNKEGHKHHHLVCENCEQITEVKENLMESIEKIVDDHYDFLVGDHQAKIFGLCKNCRTNT